MRTRDEVELHLFNLTSSRDALIAEIREVAAELREIDALEIAQSIAHKLTDNERQALLQVISAQGFESSAVGTPGGKP